MQSAELTHAPEAQTGGATRDDQHTIRVVILIALLFVIGLITCIPSIF